MKVDKPDDVKVVSTIVGDEVQFRLDENSLIHIMSILTDLYSDSEMAVIREYSTNASDSHIEAGQTRPIEVTTPTAMSPYLVIRDFGVGLSAEELREVYSKYGASTKRDTNEQTGMLGFGCKSALAYTAQFTLVGIKDGIKSQVSASRDDSGAASLTLVRQEPTDEPNGVTVTIPVQRTNDIQRKAESFFSYWPRGSVLLNGEVPRRVDGIWLSDTMAVVRSELYDYAYSSYSQNHVVVMGNVPYPCSLEGVALNHGYRVVAFTEVGTLNFVPSREELQDTKKTRATLARLSQEFKENVQEAIQREIDSAKTPYEAIGLARRLRHVLPGGRNGTYFYKGTEIPETLEFDPPVIWVERHTDKMSDYKKVRHVSPYDAPIVLWFDRFDSVAMTATKKKKLVRWCAENQIDAPHAFVLCERRVRSQWIDPRSWHSWEDVQAIRLPRQTVRKSGGRPAGAYDAFVSGRTLTYGVEAKDIEEENLFWRSTPVGNCYAWAGIVEEHVRDFTLVPLGLNRVDKFQRTFPDAQRVDRYIQACYSRWLRSLSRDEAEAVALNQEHRRSTEILKQLDPKEVSDPALRRFIRLAKRDVSGITDRLYRYRQLLKHETGALARLDDPLERYPLIRHHYRLDLIPRNQILDYLNSLYSAKYKERACSSHS